MKENYNATHLFRRVAQLGSATGLGPVGRRFKSYLADQFIFLLFNNISDNLCGHLLIDLF